MTLPSTPTSASVLAAAASPLHLTILDNHPIATLVLDRTRRIHFANKAADRLLFVRNASGPGSTTSSPHLEPPTPSAYLQSRHDSLIAAHIRDLSILIQSERSCTPTTFDVLLDEEERRATLPANATLSNGALTDHAPLRPEVRVSLSRRALHSHAESTAEFDGRISARVAISHFSYNDDLYFNLAVVVDPPTEDDTTVICDALPHLVYSVTDTGDINYFSRAWADYTGLSIDVLTTHSLQHILHTDDFDKIMTGWQNHFAEGNTGLFSDECRLRRHDGVYRWFEIKTASVKNARGDIVKYHGTCTDIDDLILKRSEAQRQKNQMMRGLLHSNVQVTTYNADYTLQMIAGAIHPEVPDHLRNSSLGRSIFDILEEMPHPIMRKIATNFRSLFAGEVDTLSTVTEYGTRAYKNFYMVDEYDDADSNGNVRQARGLIVTAVDVTDMKARKALEAENTRLEVDERLAQNASRQKSTFLANMSHEIRTPLAGVIGMLQLLGETTLDEVQRDYVHTMDSSAQLLLTIVNDVLDMARVESGRLVLEQKAFSLLRMVKGLEKMTKGLARQKSVALVTTFDLPKDVLVVGDSSRIQQILSNLLSNAVKFTAAGGTVKFCGQATETPEGANKLLFTFTISDDGIGIDADKLGSLFKPFSQADTSTVRLYGGTGLGLAICRSLADLMQSEISLQSTRYVGTTATFTIALPKALKASSPVDQLLSTDEDSSSKGQSRKRKASRFNGSCLTDAHILLVEDNSVNQKIVLKFLNQLGYKNVKSAWNGVEALQYLSATLEHSSKRHRHHSPSSSPNKVTSESFSPNEANPELASPRKVIPASTASVAASPSRPRSASSPSLLDPLGNDKPIASPAADGSNFSPATANPMISSAITESTTLAAAGDAATISPTAAATVADNVTARPPAADVRSLPHLGPVDIILMDVQMPVMDGYVASRKIRTEFPFAGDVQLSRVPIIALTASAIQGDREKCLEAGMSDYLAKPVRKETLRKVLVKWISGEGPRT